MAYDIESTIDLWEDEVLYWADQRATYANSNSNTGTYQYDFLKICYMLADWTGDTATWYAAANKAYASARAYVLPNNGQIQTLAAQIEGLRMHWKRQGVIEARNLLTTQAYNMPFSVFNNVFTTDSYFTNADGRWTALGAPNVPNSGIVNGIRDIVMPAWVVMMCLEEGISVQQSTDEAYVAQATELVFDFFDMCFVDNTAWYRRPFMIALAAQYLIMWEERYGPDSRVLTSIKAACDFLDTLWVPRGTTGTNLLGNFTTGILPEDCGSWFYTDRNVNWTLDPNNVQGGGKSWDSANLNGGILPMYSYVYYKDPAHPVRYRDRADEAFISMFNTTGVGNHDRNAYNAWSNMTQKEFNETNRWLLDHFRWRNLTPRYYDLDTHTGGARADYGTVGNPPNVYNMVFYAGGRRFRVAAEEF